MHIRNLLLSIFSKNVRIKRLLGAKQVVKQQCIRIQKRN